RLVPTWQREGVSVLRTLDDARYVREAIFRGDRVTIVGAGFIGAEIASAVRSVGAVATVVEADSAPLARVVGREMGAALIDMHHRNGTDIRCGITVRNVRGAE